MADQYRQPYLDSSVFIAWIKGEVVNGVDRGRVGSHIFTLAEHGDFKVYISALTLAEVHKKRGRPALATPEDEKVLAFFEHDYIELIDVDRVIGEQANGFCRQYTISPNDAIHLACALRAACDVLLTWDVGLTAVRHADIRVEEPQMLGQLTLDVDTDGG